MLNACRNLCLFAATNDPTPRGIATIRWFLAMTLAIAMMVFGFIDSIRNSLFGAWADGFASYIGVGGLLVFVGGILMLLGGYLSASFWQEVSQIRRNAAR